MKRRAEEGCATETTLVMLPRDLLSLIASNLDAFDRTLYGLVCRTLRCAIDARKEQLYWYVYTPLHRTFVASVFPVQEEYESLCVQLRPSIFKSVYDRRAHVIRVMSIWLQSTNEDKEHTIRMTCHTSASHPGYWQPSNWPLVTDRNPVGHRPQDRSMKDDIMYYNFGDGRGGPISYDGYHCKFMFFHL
jgi:hypothetical protein